MSPDFSSFLHTHFGFTSFRAGQEEAIQSLLNTQHTLAIMPTGAGKSLIYQLASLLLGAGLAPAPIGTGVNPAPTTLVISPLIALMKDQVDALNRKGIPATFINSAIPTTEQNQRLTLLSQGKYQLVYVAPERLRSVTFLRSLQNLTLSLLAIDEAHCISEWGHDFRPDYLHIAEARRQLGNPLTVALTATATPKVQSDIVRLLGLPEATTRIVTGFNRPNLTLEVKYTADTEAKFRALSELLGSASRLLAPQGSSIIYTGTRRDAEEVAEFVRVVCKRPAEHYHAGLPAEDRTRIQERFINGSTPVIVATNAFGMGIDRADVRQVIHYSVPGSLEAYYQEAGRAGRDGHPARAVLLYDPQDRALQEFFIQNSLVSSDELQLLYRVLGNVNDEAWLTTEDFQRRTELHPVKIKVGLAELERVGALEHLGDDGFRMSLRKGKWDPLAIQRAAARSKEHIRHRTEQLDHIIHYAETNSCRRRIVLKHFGDNGNADAPVCCDNCESRRNMPQSSGDVAQMNHAERAALVILDCIRRVKVKVGRTKLAQILHGSKAQDILNFHHDKNAYYGRLAAVKQSDIEALINQLVELRYIKIIGGEYPTLALTPQGENAVQQKESITLRLPKSLQSSEIKKTKAKLEAGGTVEYTAKLFSDGMEPEQIARERGLTLITIYGHSAKLIEAGKLDVDKVIAKDVKEKIENAIRKVGSTQFLFPIKSLLPDEITYEMIRCVVASQTSEVFSESHDPKSANHHVFELGESGSSAALPELFAALKSEDGNTRRLAASALGKIKDAQAVQPLMDLLATESKPQVRQYAVKALGSIGDNRVTAILTKIAKDENEMYYTRDSAKAALQRCRNREYDKTSEVLETSEVSTPSDSEVEKLILECVKSLPAQLPRSGVAKLLVGSNSERAKAYQSHPLYNRLEGKSRSEIMIYIDELLGSGQLQKAENGYLILNQTTSSMRSITNSQLRNTQHDSISSFLSSSHPRPLKGNWHIGFALDFHSSYKGADWNRSGIGDLVYRLKYESDASALPALVEHTRKLFAAHPEMSQFDIIVPVPSSAQREFSPVHEFCKTLSNALSKPMQTCIIKTRQTKPQKEMHTLPQKRDNVAGAFALNNDITGKSILLIDDLFDSGATLEEITRLLLKHKAAQVNVLTLTRTIHADA